MQKKTIKKPLASKTTKAKNTNTSAVKSKPAKKTAPKLNTVRGAQKMMPASPQHTTSQPSSLSLPKDERNWAMYCHLAALSGFIIPLGFILGPLIIWLVKRDEFRLVDMHGKAALNFQISMTIYFIISALLAFIMIGFVFIVALIIMEIVFVVLASIKAQEGGFYQYPLAINFIKYRKDD